MSYVRYKSIAEIATRLSLLQDQILLSYENLDYPKEGDPRSLMDVRSSSLGTILSETAINVMILNMLVAAEAGVIPHDKFRSIIGINDKSTTLKYVSYQMSSYLRLAYVTMVQFRIENLITRILSALNNKKTLDNRYPKKIKALLDIVELEDKEKSLRKLMVLQHMRNGLHSNGVHNNDSVNIVIGDCLFNFEKGKPIGCASWEHIIIALETSLIIVEKILKTPKVKAIHKLDYTD